MSQTVYRNDLIKLGFETRFPNTAKDVVAVKAPVCAQTIGRIFDGKNVSVSKLKAFTDFLGMNWEHVFDFKLSERQFHRALLANGNRRAGR